MKRLAWMAALALALVVAAAYGWNPQQQGARAQGGSAQSYSLPIVMRMSQLTPTATPLSTATATAIPSPTPTPVPPPPYYPMLISVSSGGTQAQGNNMTAAISATGRYVAFYSVAANLVPGDTNGASDVFRRDIVTGETLLVSVAYDGGPSQNASTSISESLSISADGRYVVFTSLATNLVPGDTNGLQDVLVRDMLTNQTRRVSVSSAGTQGNNVSSSGAISADGRYISFQSAASNLVPGDTNWFDDTFVHDLQTGQTTRVSLIDGMQIDRVSLNLDISADGNVIVFAAGTGEFVLYAHDRRTGQTRLIVNGTQSPIASISADGRFVTFPSPKALVPEDTNGVSDVYVHDMLLEQTTRVSVASDGSQANNGSGFPAGTRTISGDGRFVTFYSSATNLVPNDSNGHQDIFVRDLHTNQTRLVSLAYNGAQGVNMAEHPAISADGRFIVYDSFAGNLIPNDTNPARDIFLQLSPLAP